MKATEYGGGDTDKTLGIHPAPHEPTADEKLRIMYMTQDPAEPTTAVIPGVVSL